MTVALTTRALPWRPCNCVLSHPGFRSCYVVNIWYLKTGSAVSNAAVCLQQQNQLREKGSFTQECLFSLTKGESAYVSSSRRRYTSPSINYLCLIIRKVFYSLFHLQLMNRSQGPRRQTQVLARLQRSCFLFFADAFQILAGHGFCLWSHSSQWFDFVTNGRETH